MFRGAALALVGLGWVAVWWSERAPDGDAPPELGPPPAAETGEQPRPQAVIVAPPAGVTERAAVAPAEDEAEPAPGAESPAPEAAGAPHAAAARQAEPATDEIAIEGTIVVTDPEGVEHPYESGSMSLIVWQGDRGQRERVEVSRGRWSAEVPAGATLSFDDVALGDRSTLVDEEGHVPIPASRRIAVQARWPPASLLRVRSAATRQDLAGIELALGRQYGFAPTSQHPEVVATDAASPIDVGRALAGRDAGRRVWLLARAEGFAWGRIEIDLAAGGEEILDLVPGGALHVSLTGEDPPGATLRLRRDGESSPSLELAVFKVREHELMSLMPGSYSISVELGEWFQDPVVLGSSVAEVVAGGVTPVSIEVVSRPKGPTARLRGTLVVDPGWGAVEPALSIESIGTPPDGHRIRQRLQHGELSPGASGTWTFDVGSVPHGEYEFEVEHPSFVVARRVDAETGHVRIEVPAPAIAAVRVIDAEGLEVEGLDHLMWSPVRPDAAGGFSSKTVARDPGSGRFEIHAPAGRISVSLMQLELEGEATFDLHPGRQDLDFLVRRSMGFSVVLREGEKTLFSGIGWMLMDALQIVSGAGEMTGLFSKQGGGDEGVWVRVSAPGIYRFALRPIDGYEPIPEQEVLVPERGYVEHVVPLVRSP